MANTNLSRWEYHLLFCIAESAMPTNVKISFNDIIYCRRWLFQKTVKFNNKQLSRIRNSMNNNNIPIQWTDNYKIFFPSLLISLRVSYLHYKIISSSYFWEIISMLQFHKINIKELCKRDKEMRNYLFCLQYNK